jgi:hypothetical protein
VATLLTGHSGFDLWQGKREFFSLPPHRSQLWGLPSLIFNEVLVIKWAGHETDHSPLSSAEVKNAWSYTSTPICLHGMMLNEAQEQL